ncbi:hypothetical protein ADIARSV_1216 [Arcticibacter svalbardensis MN12-7]|uniref:Uncharacterized protein n=1 Tax=Arcticibacter svalbardensis MN12-7 TaxID=1150600 RepID=R9GVS0_9SPHI|nr:hypothetical protein [Arcticibacter svalbardensis]EOR95610.1 hypothetical protein ADIARSV_1216 [Arcticibacter svalbardensis MN12-7]
MNNKKIKKDDALSEEDIERMELLRLANENVGKQLSIGSETGGLEEIDELRQLIGREFENPEEKYNVYYLGIRRLLMQYLPKGKEFKEMRDIIYDEKNVFLNAGKKKSDHNGIRGSDSRMSFQSFMNEILDVTVLWVGSSQNPFELYKLLYDLNDKFDYGHENYGPTSTSVAKGMMALAK